MTGHHHHGYHYHSSSSVYFQLGGMPLAHRSHLYYGMMSPYPMTYVQPSFLYARPLVSAPPRLPQQQPTRVVYDVDDWSSAMYAPVAMPDPSTWSGGGQDSRLSGDFSAAVRRGRREQHASARLDAGKKEPVRFEGHIRIEGTPPSRPGDFNAKAEKKSAPAAAPKSEWPHIEKRGDVTIYTWENQATRTEYAGGTVVERYGNGDVAQLTLPGGKPQPVKKTEHAHVTSYATTDGATVNDYPSGFSIVSTDLNRRRGQTRILANGHTVTPYGDKIAIEQDKDHEVVGMTRLPDGKKLPFTTDTSLLRDATQFLCMEARISAVLQHNGTLQVRDHLGMLPDSPMHKRGAAPAPSTTPAATPEKKEPARPAFIPSADKKSENEWTRDPVTNHWTNNGPTVEERLRRMAAADTPVPEAAPGTAEHLAGPEMPKVRKATEMLAELSRSLSEELARRGIPDPAKRPIPDGPRPGPAPSERG